MLAPALLLPLGILIAAMGHPHASTELMAPRMGLAGELKALEPAEGATVGPKPVFRFSAPSGWASEGGAIIELSRDRWKSVEKAWDIRISRRGWETPPEPLDRTGAFRCIEPLSEGAWEWRVRPSEGSIDAGLPGGRPFKVDATPPAEIEGLKLHPGADGSLLLTWEPVVTDVEGRPETIDHYVVYRYGARGTFPQTPPMVIGRATGLSFVDRHPSSRPAPGRPATAKGSASGSPRAESDLGADRPAGRGSSPGGTGRGRAPGAGDTPTAGAGTIYYKVVAVDLAGNELGIRDQPVAEARSPLPALRVTPTSEEPPLRP